MPWEKVIDKEVKSSDKEDLGKVQSVVPHYIEVKEGSVRKKRSLFQNIIFKDMMEIICIQQ
jgi:hypothetical protein